ncbi:2-succinyl-6-hydroxy-2,4-cyclohexadiene-1-carboxylate synthase [Erwinia sp. CPCC 100877]|nr:2-succinyl-6-hydroxy-2,4-cyclohexadiene-1-carboxylate synthase [Erwinia sp. CPCC 100877]
MKIEINGVNYYYRWLTPYEAERPTLVCLHGFTGTSQTFVPMFQKQLALNVLAIDLIGHGHTDVYVHPYRYQMSCLCDDLAYLTEALGIFSFALLGYSMGARTALSFACQYPEKVRQLILESGSPGLKTAFERTKRRISDERLAAFIMKHSVEEFVEKWQQLPLFDTQKNLSLADQAAVYQERVSQRQFGLACSLWFMGTGAQASCWEQLSELNMPILAIVGALDSKFQQIARNMQEKQAHLLIESIAQAGHCIHLEQPKAFEQKVLTFLERGSTFAD